MNSYLRMASFAMTAITSIAFGFISEANAVPVLVDINFNSFAGSATSFSSQGFTFEACTGNLFSCQPNSVGVAVTPAPGGDGTPAISSLGTPSQLHGTYILNDPGTYYLSVDLGVDLDNTFATSVGLVVCDGFNNCGGSGWVPDNHPVFLPGTMATYVAPIGPFFNSADILSRTFSISFYALHDAGDFQPGGRLYLDNFKIVATPIPAALPLFATGLGVLGLLGWRRKRHDQTAG